MTSARDLVSRLRKELAGVEQRLFTHPWIGAVEAGRLGRGELTRFAAEQRRIIASDQRSVALLVHRYGGTPSGSFFAESLKTETAALEALNAFLRALGVEEDALTLLPPLAGA